MSNATVIDVTIVGRSVAFIMIIAPLLMVYIGTFVQIKSWSTRNSLFWPIIFNAFRGVVMTIGEGGNIRPSNWCHGVVNLNSITSRCNGGQYA